MQNTTPISLKNKTVKSKEKKEADENNTIFALKKLLKGNPNETIANLEYMIKKLTTHTDDMKKKDFKAIKSIQNIICFLNACKTFKLN